MTRQTRQSDQRDLYYTPANDLTLPEGMEKYYNNNGYHLRWIRAELQGQDDSRNISMKIREGYQFIQKSEVPEEWRDFFDTRKVRNNNQIICVGDLILGKIEIAKAEARQRHFENASTERVTQAKGMAYDGKGTGNSDGRMDRMVPVLDESRSVVKTGENSQE